MFHTSFNLPRTAVAAAIAVGIAIAISSLSVVRAERYSPEKKTTTFKCSTGTACLTADSSGANTWGFLGEASSTNAIQGETSATNGSAGVAGISEAKSGRAEGVYAASNTGDGVYGITNAPIGSTQPGYAGVFGLSSTTNGVLGEIGSSSSAPSAAVAAWDYSAGGYLFYGVDPETSNYCLIDADADLDCTGAINGGAFKMRQRSSSGRHVLAYSPESASATIEDVGTARMRDGVANVQISEDFAAVMDGRWYYVFLTPLGDTRGLYVSMKMASGFQVKETERGRDSLEFDYRIVAHPLGASNDRLPADSNVRRLAQFTR